METYKFQEAPETDNFHKPLPKDTSSEGVGGNPGQLTSLHSYE